MVQMGKRAPGAREAAKMAAKLTAKKAARVAARSGAGQMSKLTSKTMSGAKNIKPPYFQALVRTGTDPGLGSYRCRIQQSEIILKPYTKSLPTISIFVNPAQFHMAVASMRSGQAGDRT